MSNEKAISRIDEIIVCKQNEITSLRYARGQLSDPIWDKRDGEEADANEFSMIVKGLNKANEADATKHKDHCVCFECMPNHPNHPNHAHLKKLAEQSNKNLDNSLLAQTRSDKHFR